MTHPHSQDPREADPRREEAERRRVLTDVESERDTVAALVDSITDEIWYADTDGVVTLVNPAVWREFGAVKGDSIEEIASRLEVYRADGTLRPPEEAPPLRALQGETIKDEEEIVRTPAGGDLRHRLVSGAPVLHEGAIVGSVCVVRDVTERRRAEEAVRKSERELLAFIEASSDVVYRMSPHWSEMRQLRGRGFLSDTTDPSTSWLDAYLPESDRQTVLRAIEESIRKKTVFELEHRVLQADGTIGWIFSRAMPLLDAHGEIVEWIGTATDITTRRRTEAALGESEARLRFHLENTPLAVVEWDAGFIVTRWAGEAEAMFGYRASETVGKPVMDLGLVHEDDAPVIEQTMEKLTDGVHTQVVSSNRNLTRDGRVIDCTWFNSVLLDEQGRMSSVMSLVQDNTERRRAEAALRESEERLGLALAVGGIATWDFHVDTGEVVWNAEHYRMLGYEPGEVPAGYEAFLARVHPEDAASVDAAFRESLSGGTDYTADFRVVRPDGEVRCLTAEGHLEVDPAGRPLRQYGVMFDVTERVEAERALRVADAERAAQAERARLARDLHDSVTQALFAASLKAEALASAPDLLAPVTAATVEDVRRLSRGALAQMRTMLLELRGDPIQDVPIRQLLGNLAESAESRAHVDVWVTVEGEHPLPPQVHIAVYRVAQEALNNVVRHAAAANAWVELRAGRSSAELTVRDDGRGFERAPGDPSHVGLASMRERAAEVGAQLEVESTAGRGTCVVLRWQEPG
jgi:PAS domain S-box-containing protein